MSKSLATAALVMALASADAAPGTIDQIKAADWKLYGFTTFQTQALALFYSANVRRLPNGHIELWTKGLSTKGIQNIQNPKASDELARRVAWKLARSYVPPIATTDKLTQEATINAVTSEEIADGGLIRPTIRILYELDCFEQLIRELSTYADSGGETQSSNDVQEWQHVAPETTASTLTAMLCRS